MPYPTQETYPSSKNFPGSESSSLVWDDPLDRYFQTGIDRGVLYIDGKGAIAWNGITAFDESGNGKTSILYRDGQIYLADADATDFSGSLRAVFFPDEFSECVGMPEAADGLYVDNQKPKRFGFSYRSLIGSGATGDLFGYQIHLVYNAIATIGVKNRKTVTDRQELTDFNFDIVCTPVKMKGYRPTAHYIIDTRHLDPDTIARLEGMLYGSAAGGGMLPNPDDLFDLLNFGNSITVTDLGDGYFQIDGAFSNVHMLTDDIGEAKNINAVVNPDGTIDISDGGDTTIVTI